MRDENEFWCVWNPNHGVPTMRHETEDAANAEAQRLASSRPGARFYVMRAARYFARIDVARVELRESDERPF
jgi:hypothetical protein